MMTEKPSCPTEQELALFSHNQLDAEVAVRVREHLETCEVCADTIDCLHENDDTRSWDDSPLDEIPPHIASVSPPKSSIEETSFLSPAQDSGYLGMLGSYRVLKRIGVGGMGIVFEAEDPQLNRHVALKIIKPEYAVQEVARERFLREAQAVAAINHDNVVAIYQVGEAEALFLTMPLLEGETLATRVSRQETTPASEVLRIGREVAAGLGAAHKRGVIHRDIKPANIWLEADSDRVKLLDFGLARPTDLDSNLTMTGAIAGTPRYMSPEQVEAREIDQRTDLFSLGCVLYRMLTGNAPFAAPTPLAVLSAMANENVVPPHEIVKDVPRPLSELVMRLLKKEPDNRPQSAAIVIKEIETIEKSLESPGPEPQLLGVRRRLSPMAQVAVILFTVGMLALGAIVILIKHKDGTESTYTLPTSHVESIQVEQDGELLADVDVNVRAALAQPSLRPNLLDQLKPIPLPPGVPTQANDSQLVAILGDDRLSHWGPVTCAVFSPDGSLLATGGYDRVLKLWNTKTGEEVHALHGHGGSIFSLAFSSDGSTLVSAGHLKKVIVWDVQSGEKNHEWTPPASTLQLVTFDSHDQPLAIGVRSEGVVAWEVTTGDRKFAVATKLLPDWRFALNPDDRLLAVVSRGSREMQVFDTESGDLLFSVPANTALGTAAVFTPDGSRLAYLEAESIDRTIQYPAKKVVVCDAKTGELIRSFDSESAATLTISPDGKLLSAGGIYTTRVWEIDTGREVHSLERHPLMVNAITIDSASEMIATTSYDGSVKLWSLESGEQLITRDAHRASINCVALSPDGTTLATGGVDQKVVVWDLESRKPLRELPRQPGLVTRVEFGMSGAFAQRLGVVSQSFAPYNETGGFSLWDATTGNLIRSFGPIAHSITDFDQHAPGQVVSIESDGTAVVSEAASKKWLMTLQEKGLRFSTAAFSPDGKSVVTGADSGEVLHWKVGFDDPPTRLMQHGDEVTVFAFSQDGRYLVSGGLDDDVKVWDFVGKEIVKEIAGQADGVVSLAVTADGSQIAWSSYGGILRLWKQGVPEPQTLFQFDEGTRHHTNRRFTQITFSPEGRYLATANQNGTVFIFRIAESPAPTVPTSPISARDVSDNSNHGKIFDATRVSPIVLPMPDAAGYALKFDGMNCVEVPSFRYDGIHPVTVEAWVTPNRIADGTPFVNVLTIKGAATLRLNSKYQWMAVAPRDITTGDLDVAKSEAIAAIGRRTHLALVRDDTQVRLYVDGKKQAETIDTLAGHATSQSFRIGGHITEGGDGQTNLFHGTIDEVRISSVARYVHNFFPKRRFQSDDATMALYHFDEGKGEMCEDVSGNELHGKAIGAQWVKVDTSAARDEPE